MDSLKKVIGRASYQVLVDSTGKGCVLSWQNETNLADKDLLIGKALDDNLLWNILPNEKGAKGAVSVLLVFTFSEDRVKYQHLFKRKQTAELTELEYSEKSKVSRW